DVVVDVLDRPVHAHPGHAQLLELHAGHRPGRVLEERLVHAQGDRVAGGEVPLHQVVGQDLAGGVVGHRRPQPTCGISRARAVASSTSPSPSAVAVTQRLPPRAGSARARRRTKEPTGAGERRATSRRAVIGAAPASPTASAAASSSAAASTPPLATPGGPWWSCLTKN